VPRRFLLSCSCIRRRAPRLLRSEGSARSALDRSRSLAGPTSLLVESGSGTEGTIDRVCGLSACWGKADAHRQTLKSQQLTQFGHWLANSPREGHAGRARGSPTIDPSVSTAATATIPSHCPADRSLPLREILLNLPTRHCQLLCSADRNTL